MTIDMQVALWAVGIIFAIGGAYADTRRRIMSMEKKLGNGHGSYFLSAESARLMKQDADEEHAKIRQELALVRGRTYEQSNLIAVNVARLDEHERRLVRLEIKGAA